MQILVLKSEVAVTVCIYMERPPPIKSKQIREIKTIGQIS